MRGIYVSLENMDSKFSLESSVQRLTIFFFSITTPKSAQTIMKGTKKTAQWVTDDLSILVN